MRSVSILLILGTTATFHGCGPTQSLGFGSVQRDWSTTFRQLGITPVFPPREDFFVGDVYVTGDDSGGLRGYELFEKEWEDLEDWEKEERLRMGMNPRLARLNINGKIEKEYLRTISAAPTTPDLNVAMGDMNPAIKAAAEKVENASKAKAIAEKAKTDQKKVLDKANEMLAEKQRDLAAANGALAKAEADLLAAEGAKPEGEIAAAQTRVNSSRTDLATAEQALEAATIANSPSTPHTQAVLDSARRARDTQLEMNIWWEKQLKDHIDAGKAISAGKMKVQEAKTAVNDATKNQSDSEQDRDTEETKLATITARDSKKIEASSKALIDAKATLAAIKKTGANMLQVQPNMGRHSVYGEKGGHVSDHLKDRVNRLRLVAFPDFSAVSYKGANAAALIPVEAFKLGVNISSSSIESVSVKIPAAESYSISITDIMDKVSVNKIDKDGKRVRGLTEGLFQTASFQTQSSGKSSCCDQVFYMRVVSEVFYARAMDIGVFSGQSNGFAANLSSPPLPTGGDDNDTTPSPLAPNGFSGVPAGTATGLGSTLPGSTLASIGSTASTPGGSVQLVSYNQSSVGLRRLFHRPIAIGYRGVMLTVHVHTDCDGKPFGFISDVGPVAGPTEKLND